MLGSTFMLAFFLLSSTTAQEERVICKFLCLEKGTVTVSGYGNREPGDVATVTCEDGYHLVGASTLTCQDDGEWSTSRPKCVADVSCPYITGISLGRVTAREGSTRPGGSVTFACNSDRRLEGAAKVTCTSDGSWDKLPPSCVDARCPVFRGLDNGEVIKQDTAPSGTVKFKCDVNFQLTGQETLTCGANGQWNGKKPECKNLQCPHISDFAHGGIEKYSRKPGSVIKFSCDAGYKLDGADTLTCSDGQWSTDMPECIRDNSVTITKKMKTFNSCPHFNLDNGSCYGKRIAGRKLTCKCNSGYKMTGDSIITCNKDKLEYPSKPQCKLNQCSPFEFIKNGYVKDGTKPPYLPGDNINVLCHPGFTSDKSRTMTCGDDLKWSHITECKPVVCPHKQFFENGQVKEHDYTNTPTDSPFYLSCDTGFKLQGDFSVRCEQKGTWSNEFPSCVRAETCVVPCVGNGSFSQSRQNGETHVFYFCNKKYTLEGSRERTCKDGIWSGPAPTCVLAGGDSSGGEKVCRNKPLDIFFVCDSSLSIKNNELEEARKAIRFLISLFDLGKDKTRIALIHYNHEVIEEIDMGEFRTKGLIEKIKILQRGDYNSVKAGTRTDLAMHMMMDRFQFKTPFRDRMCVLLTDGKSTAEKKEMRDMITRLEATGILTFAIGVGYNYSETELRTIATGPGDQNVYSAKDYTDLAKIAPSVVKEICNTPTNETVTPVEECKEVSVDACFLVDISKSIGPTEYVNMKNAILKMIGAFDLTTTRIALIKFWDRVEREFTFGDYNSIEEYQDILQKRNVDDEGGTRTDLGVEDMKQLFKSQGSPSKKRITFTVTDGKSTAKPGELKKKIDELNTAVPDMTRVAVGVGKDADQDELKMLSSDPDQLIYRVENYERLMQGYADVVASLCERVNV